MEDLDHALAEDRLLDTPRSGQWPRVREAHLAKHPTCAVCGGKERLEVHHIKPFHLHPELETSMDNLITLCESGADGANHHLLFGHLGSFRSFNPDVVRDAKTWLKKIQGRKYEE